MLIHGFGEGAYVWNRFVPSISRLFRTFTIDLRGHGDSSWDPTGQYLVQRHVTDVMGLIDALQLKRLVIVGHSLGGEIAIRIAAARSNEVVGLAVVDYAPNPVPEGSERVRSDFNESMHPWRSVEEYASWLRERRPLVDPDLIQELASSALRKASKEGFRPKCDPAMGKDKTAQCQAEIWRLLGAILVPTLIIKGVGSAVVSNAMLRQMQDILRSACTRVVDRAGHAVMTDNPEGFAAALSPFLMQMRMSSSIEGHG